MRAFPRLRVLSTALCLKAGLAQGSVVAIIDSGLDNHHKDLVPQVWVNPLDSDYDGVDNDANGYRDDIHGWNFTQNNNEIIDYKYASVYVPEIGDFFERQGRTLMGTASTEDIDWMRERIQDKEFLKSLMTYGNYAHGTHVAGIVAYQAPEAKAIGIKLIPTESPLAGLTGQIAAARADGKDLNMIVKEVIKVGLSLLAKAQGLVFEQVGTYVASTKADVANASLGVGAPQLKMLLTPLLKMANGGQEVPSATLDEMVQSALVSFNREQAALLRAAPETLFVFAAGNDGSSNDTFPTAPASIEHPHAISVAAVFADGRLAPFSNYGRRVSVAAPGVVIESTTPNHRRMVMSGTSQAAPYVAGVAALIKDTNPDLSPSEIKRIILETVDLRPDLKDKVLSGGVVNARRAQRAAALSVQESLKSAIAAARTEVPSALAPETGKFMDPIADLIGPVIQPSLLGG